MASSTVKKRPTSSIPTPQEFISTSVGKAVKAAFGVAVARVNRNVPASKQLSLQATIDKLRGKK